MNTKNAHITKTAERKARRDEMVLCFFSLSSEPIVTMDDDGNGDGMAERKVVQQGSKKKFKKKKKNFSLCASVTLLSNLSYYVIILEGNNISKAMLATSAYI